MQQFIVSLFLLFIVALAVYWRTESTADAQPQYVTYSLERGNILTAIKTTGIVEPLKEIEVSAQTNGIITALGSDPLTRQNRWTLVPLYLRGAFLQKLTIWPIRRNYLFISRTSG